ncbi:hypothetical protein GCM10025875_10730 [Litorihabitans aurantiacus]|uniref:Uncharacterized protein n=1 Tax=Litorihabitans aurantiacus TaxID=1930061 RepID=A0AA37XD48_9MICO|nr:hypothetical protein GCM10025875_10730 [Litorihabitans aurantiacus]
MVLARLDEGFELAHVPARVGGDEDQLGAELLGGPTAHPPPHPERPGGGGGGHDSPRVVHRHRELGRQLLLGGRGHDGPVGHPQDAEPRRPLRRPRHRRRRRS